MRSQAIALVLALNTALALWAVTPSPKKTGAKKTTAKTTAAKTTVAKTTAGKTSKSKTTAKSTSAKAKSSKQSSKQTAKQTSKQAASTRYRRSTQREPAPERYQEIQQSLADKGYFGGSVNGTWGPESVDALKRFQRDQNIGDDGKLGSLSLIALGLGPKRGEKQ